MSKDFQDQVVLVTGAAGALGARGGRTLCRRGATIAQLDVVDIDNGHYCATL